MSSSEAAITKKKNLASQRPRQMVIIANGYSTSFLNYYHLADRNSLGAVIGLHNHVLTVIPPSEWYITILCFLSFDVAKPQNLSSATGSALPALAARN